MAWCSIELNHLAHQIARIGQCDRTSTGNGTVEQVEINQLLLGDFLLRIGTFPNRIADAHVEAGHLDSNERSDSTV